MKKKIIVLCTPSLGKVSIWWTRQITNLLWPMNIGRRILFLEDDKGGEIAEARNKIVSMALSLENDSVEVDALFWVDDDVLVSNGALLQLYSHHAPIAAGVYFTKGEPYEPLLFPGRVQGSAKWVPGFVGPMWGVAGGLTLVKASVYKQLLPFVARDKYGNPQWYRTDKKYTLEGEGDSLSLNCGGTEDLFFCHLVSQHLPGVVPIADCGKWTTGWHYDMATKSGYPKEQFDQWKQGNPVVWKTSEGEVVWE